MKKIVIFILLLSTVFLAIDFSLQIDYSSFDYVSWEAIQKNQLKVKLIDISKKSNSETVSEEIINTMNLFPSDERWVVKKYESKNIAIFGNNSDDEIVFNNKRAFLGFPYMKINENDYSSIIYQNKNSIIALTIHGNIEKFDKIKLVNEKLLGTENDEFENMIPQRLIDVKGEWITVLGWINAKSESPQPNYLAYMKIYRYNLITKQVDILSSFENGIFVVAPDYFQDPTQPPGHDVSLDHRYIYIPGYSGKDGIIEKYYFGKEKKMNPGLYVFDWWTLKLYKVSNKNVNAVINNTDDGYIYLRVFSDVKKNWDEVYYRFKNPEAMLNELGKK